MADRHDYLALDWVRGEIQETLNQSQQALEAFVGNADDSTRMRFCQTYLHQVYGTLQMVEFYGAALLAEEMEKLAQALLDGKVTRVTDAQETLMRAILQLPPYLDRVQASRRDLPLVLLPLLNDLRAARGETLLSETSLFKPDLAGGAGKGQVPVPVSRDPDFPVLAKKIRQMYQIALLGVIRGEKLEESYGYMGRVFNKLIQVTGEAPMAPVWEIGLAVVEGLNAGAIQPGTSLKSVLGHIDRLMRALATQGAPVLSKTPPAELLKNLLYFIAKCETESPRIRKLRDVYRLADALPSEEMISAERARMSGPDQAAMSSVVQALSEELAKVKDALEVFIANDETDAGKLSPLSQILKQVGDTVAVLGLGQPRKLIIDQIAVLEAMAAGERGVDRDALMDVAGALLYVEATLQGLTGERRQGEREGVLARVPDHVEKARDAVIRECRAALEQAKDGIVEFIASQWDQSHLGDVPGRLTAVRGGLEIIQLPRPGAILRQCVRYISERLIGQNAERPEWRNMDTLADAITSVEYYLERLSDDPETTDEILDLARSSVGELGYDIADGDFGRGATAQPAQVVGVGALVSEEIDIALPQVTAEAPVPAPAAPERPKIRLRRETPKNEGEDLPEISDEDLAAFEEAEAERLRPEEEAREPEARAEPSLAAVAEAAEDSLIDEEIIEIFVEEAGEVLSALDEFFPRWAANQNDEQALVEFRRAFHTLKGSGRMVGALTIGELAWSVENMMNRVIDRSIQPSNLLVDLVRRVHRIIPDLVEAFRARKPDPWDVEPLKAAAFALAEGGAIEAVPEVRAPGAGALTDVGQGDDADEAASGGKGDDASATGRELPDELPDDTGDWTLMDIFRHEARSNIVALRGWLEGVDPDLSENPIADEVHRALHTLKGSARMAGVQGVAAVAEPAEHYVKALVGNRGAMADRDAVALIGETVDVLERGLAGLREGAAELDGAPDLVRRLQAANREVAPESGEAGGDPSVLSPFLAQGMDLIMDAEALLDRWAADPAATEELARLHRELREFEAAATRARLKEVEELAAALAGCYQAVLEGRARYSDQLKVVATGAQDALMTMMDYLAAGQALLRDEPLLEALRRLAEGSPDDDPDGGPEVEEIFLGDLTPGHPAGEDGAPVEATPPAPAPPRALSVETPAPVTKPEGELESVGEIDPELVGIFLEEAQEVLESASAALDAWQNGDAGPVAGLQRDLHTLKGGARMAGISAIGDLAHELENLYEGFNNGQFRAEPELFGLLHRCHDCLADMVDSVRSDGACRRAPDLVSAIHRFLAGEALAAPPAAAAGSPAAPEALAPGESASPARTLSESLRSEDAIAPGAEQRSFAPALEKQSFEAAPPERDEELVGIFLEEADEILESAGTSLESWMEAPDNLLEVQSLQRDLHTLKGGARMAEIPELGDLGHELENLYEGLALGNLKPSPALFELLQRCHDRLAAMVEAVKANRGLRPAQELINAIHACIADPAGFVLPPLADAAAAPPPAPAAAFGRAPESARIDPDILAIFVEEAAELRGNLDSQLGAWLEEPTPANGEQLKRILHTLKGGARLAGLEALGDISHEFEQALDLHDMRQPPTADMAERMKAWRRRILDLVGGLQASAQRAVAAAAPVPGPATPAATPAAARAGDERQAPKRQVTAQQQPQEMVRIGADVLEALVNLAGETSINRGRVEQGITEFAFHVAEMGNTIERLYEQLRRLDVETEAQILSNYQKGVEAGEIEEEFDPLEMDQYSELNQITRQLSESASDLLDLKNTLLDKTRDTETLLLQQSRINTELQEKLMRTRMVPFSRLVPRLRRIVRQVSGEVSKAIEFDVLNPEGELDRTLMERIVAPLEHMLRNAVDHGIEDAAGRAAAGKDATGRVTLELTREGGEVVLILADDGRGIDTAAVRRKAVERGLIDEQTQLTEQEVQQFIFSAGFSTAARVTQISGRGVGMDVVASEIKQMGGSVTIDSKKGQGTRFVIRLPFTLAMNRALMIRVGEDQYAIPLNQIDGIVRISPFELEGYIGEHPQPFVYARQSFELAYMGEFVHGHGLPAHLLSHPTPLPVLLIRSSEHQVAILVDSLIGSREVVVKSVGPQLSTVAGISGATILGDGSVVIILDIHSLIRAAHVQRQHQLEQPGREAAPAAEETAPAPVAEQRRAPLIMVTDDSVTVRKVTTRLLERNGYEVITAKDGMDAVARLEEQRPDLMLLDIEMPRMDGFEVAMHVRHEDRLKDIPIIMITSRTGEKHRERAFEIGVNSYLGKPFQESELLGTIQELLARARETAGS